MIFNHHLWSHTDSLFSFFSILPQNEQVPHFNTLKICFILKHCCTILTTCRIPRHTTFPHFKAQNMLCSILQHRQLHDQLLKLFHLKTCCLSAQDFFLLFLLLLFPQTPYLRYIENLTISAFKQLMH